MTGHGFATQLATLLLEAGGQDLPDDPDLPYCKLEGSTFMS